MYKKLAFIMAVFCVLAFSGTATAGQPDWWIYNKDCVIHFDGYLQIIEGPPVKIIQADTLIVITNTSLNTPMDVTIDIFDKYGRPVIEGALLLDGGMPIRSVPANGFGWITLAQLVNRVTMDPYETQGLAEKFSYRIWAQKPDSLMPVVEVKQFVYTAPYFLEVEGPYHGPWEPVNFSSWAETSLGGKWGTGVIWP